MQINPRHFVKGDSLYFYDVLVSGYSLHIIGTLHYQCILRKPITENIPNSLRQMPFLFHKVNTTLRFYFILLYVNIRIPLFTL